MAVYERVIHDIVPHIDPRFNLKDAAKGKTVLITGGGQGAGKAMAEQYALAGASRVIIAGRTASVLEATKAEMEGKFPECKVFPIATDVTVDSSVESLFSQLPGTPDVLINNSGTVNSQTKIAESDPAVWWKDMETTLKGTYLCTRSYLRMLDGGPGIILNVSSGASDHVGPGMSAYGTTKLAQNRFTQMVHSEYSAQGVRCIAFSPGSMAGTNMGRMAPPQFRHMLMDTVELAGGFSVYLSTPAAAFLDGRFVISNWPMEKVEEMKDEIIEKNLLVSKLDLGDHLGFNMVSPEELARREKEEKQSAA